MVGMAHQFLPPGKAMDPIAWSIPYDLSFHTLSKSNIGTLILPIRNDPMPVLMMGTLISQTRKDLSLIHI